MSASGGKGENIGSQRVFRLLIRNEHAQFYDDVETLDPNQGVTLRVIQSMKFFGALSDECLSK
jgi:hypothetical protein